MATPAARSIPPPPPEASASSPGSDAVRLRRDLIRPRYPRLSRRRGEEGTVRVRVELDSQGRVGDIELARTSGYRRLDRAAFQAVREAARGPDFVQSARRSAQSAQLTESAQSAGEADAAPASEIIDIEFRLEGSVRESAP
jgi:TonB family protein